MKKDILDLRFIIGLFFSLTGLILVIGSIVLTTGDGKSEATNFWSGLVYIAFGIVMGILWYTGKSEAELSESSDES